MVITDEMKQIVQGTAFLSLVTVNADGTPHPIVTGKAEAAGGTLIFGIFKMEKTQENLLKNNNAWVVCATITDRKPKGIRFTGTAETKDKKLVFTAAKAENLI